MTPAPAETSLEDLLTFVKTTRGFDFTGYKRSSLERRIGKRMGDVGVERYEDYVDYLELHPEEFAHLFNTVLINVTGFYRDPPTWEFLTSKILPELVERRPPEAPLRVWCAGVASGEEAYTVAMALVGVLGEQAFKDRVKIYATDADEEALDQARAAAYPPKAVEGLASGLLNEFFERTDQRYIFRKDLRRSVIFGRNDLVQDAPISRIDLLVCRNTLMYFNAETQERILRRFHFALDAAGVLLLGKSEMLLSHANLFAPIDLKRRVFRKVGRPTLRDRVQAVAHDMNNPGPPGNASVPASAFDLAPGAQIVIDRGGALVLANDAARRMFGLGAHDIGQPLSELEISYRPVELRSHLDRVFEDQRGTEIEAVHWRSPTSQDRHLDVRIVPLADDGAVYGASIAYLDISETRGLQDELEASKRELDEAHEELQSTVEELETTNEELQSTNEELETTNEELQSTNEELETMNEELQSTNEELETMNEELRVRSVELNDVNAFLETILTSMGISVTVLDSRLQIQIWNAHSRELWGVTSEEAERRHIFELDIGLPVDALKAPLKAVLAGTSEREELVVDAVNRRGKPFRCGVVCLPLHGPDAISGVIIMMEARE
jgi:two-component system, chemotaxis family, CheB/CheR fusion protein